MPEEVNHAVQSGDAQVEGGNAAQRRPERESREEPEAGRSDNDVRKTQRTSSRRKVSGEEEGVVRVGEVGRGIVEHLVAKQLVEEERRKKLYKTYVFSQKVADKFLARLADGESVVTICEDPDFPSRATIFRWRQQIPEFAEAYNIAMQCRSEGWAEELLANSNRTDGIFPVDQVKNVMKARMYLINLARKDAAAKTVQPETKPEDAKVIEGQATRVDNDPLFQAFREWEKSQGDAK